MDAMTAELDRAMTSLSKAAQPNQQPPYYIGYDAHDLTRLNILAQQGAIVSSDESHQRTADITVRIGDWKVDNTHGFSTRHPQGPAGAGGNHLVQIEQPMSAPLRSCRYH